MKRIVLVAAALAVFSCNKNDVASSSTAASSAAPEKPAPPFTGKLTSERILAAKGLVRPLMPWGEAQAKLEAQLGKPTLVKDKMNLWGVAEGDDCTYVKVERQANDEVGMVQDPAKVTKAFMFNWDECLRAAGVRSEAAEDPNAPGPPTDGKPIDVLALRAGATKARSKWSKAPVTIRGLYLNASKSTSDGKTYATVVLTAAKGDVDDTVGCDLADPSTAPEKMLQYTPITARGEVDVQDMVSLAGTRSLGVDLANCSITVSPAKKR